MDLSKLTPPVLRELLKLSELKAALHKQVAALDARIAAFSAGKPAPAAKAAPTPGKRRGRPPGKPKALKPAKAAKAPKTSKAPKAPKAPKTPKAPKAAKSPKTGSKRGSLKADIIKLLTAAGPEGSTVKDISSTLGVKSQNIHVWFSTTGKKLPEIGKVGEARYAFKAPAPAAEVLAA